MKRDGVIVAATLAVALSAGGSAVGQVNTVYSFENLAPGTSVSGQYRGVTFSQVSGATSGPCFINTVSNAASPTRALGTVNPGEEFDAPFLRMNFVQPQRFVQFGVGPGNINCSGENSNRIRVTGYNTSGALLFTRDYTVNRTTNNTLVQLGAQTGPFEIARIDVDASIPGFCVEGSEAIDDLTFLPDTTPPQVTITAPADDACVCGNAPVVVAGSVCDPDGVYVGDRLEYSEQPDGPWTFISNANGAVCGGGTLYNWNTGALPGGHYYLRVTATNADGWSTSEVRRVFIDKAPPSVNLRQPIFDGPPPVYAGQVCFDGSVGDQGCANPTWTLQWRSGDSGAWNNIAPAQTSTVTNDPLGSWNVSSVADGLYQVRLIAVDACGQTNELAPRNVVVDNTPPVALITDPLNCANVGGNIVIRGTVFDANLSGWSLQIAGGPWNTWQPLASGTSNITNGVLGVFNSTSRPQCEYVVRLIVNDRASVGCGAGVQSREFVTTISVAQPGQCDDIDFNNDTSIFDPADIEAFLRVYSEGPCVP